MEMAKYYFGSKIDWSYPHSRYSFWLFHRHNCCCFGLCSLHRKERETIPTSTCSIKEFRSRKRD